MRKIYQQIVIVIAAIVLLPFLSNAAYKAHAQGFNSIEGYVTGVGRQPIPDLNVELLDWSGQTRGHARTDTRGYFQFRGMARGNYRVRVYPFGTDYEETEVAVELVNISYGNTATAAPDQQQVDIQLKLRRGVTPESVALFVQDIPPAAKKHYEKGVEELNNKRTVEGLAELRAAIEVFPKYYYALERLGSEYIQMNKPEAYQAAAILFALAVEQNARGYKSWYGLGYSRYMLKQYENAIPAAQKAVELNAAVPDSMSLLGTLYRLTKKTAEAEKHLLKANELARGALPQIHMQLALLYANDMQRFADAAKELRLYLKANPDAPDAAGIKDLIAKYESKSKT